MVFTVVRKGKYCLWIFGSPLKTWGGGTEELGIKLVFIKSDQVVALMSFIIFLSIFPVGSHDISLNALLWRTC